MPSMFLFTGENAFALREERRRWVSEFIKKYGQENYVPLDGTAVKVRDLMDEVSTQPFLAEKRLVLLDGLPSSTKEEVQALATSIHPDVILLCIAPKIDKRTAGNKEYLNVADVKEFAPLKGKQFEQWMMNECKRLQLMLSAAARQALLEYIGEEQDLMAQELSKLALFAQGKEVSAADTEMMTIPTDEGVIWKISDLIASGSKREALRYARRLLERGGDAHGLWAILLSFLRNSVSVKAALDAGMNSGKEIADATGVHIFAIRSLQPYAKRIDTKKLQEFLAWAAQADIDLKTGNVRATDEAPQEIHALIDQFIVMAP